MSLTIQLLGLDIFIVFVLCYERYFVDYQRFPVDYWRKRRGYGRISVVYERFFVVYERFNKKLPHDLYIKTAIQNTIDIVVSILVDSLRNERLTKINNKKAIKPLDRFYRYYTKNGVPVNLHQTLRL